MAPHQSTVSWDWYLKHAAEAVEALGSAAPAIGGVVAPWWEAPGHLDAVADQVRTVTTNWSAERRAAAWCVFTAHAIPQPVEATSPYRRQMEATAAAVAQRLGLAHHRVAFQSAPSDSRIPWSSPDILAVVEEAAAAGVRDLVVQAAGFLVDHTEVLYDLDVETAEACARHGITYTRALCVHDHPAFIGALADAVMRI
jgi:ferrochelatase